MLVAGSFILGFRICVFVSFAECNYSIIVTIGLAFKAQKQIMRKNAVLKFRDFPRELLFITGSDYGSSRRAANFFQKRFEGWGRRFGLAARKSSRITCVGYDGEHVRLQRS